MLRLRRFATAAMAGILTIMGASGLGLLGCAGSPVSPAAELIPVGNALRVSTWAERGDARRRASTRFVLQGLDVGHSAFVVTFGLADPRPFRVRPGQARAQLHGPIEVDDGRIGPCTMNQLPSIFFKVDVVNPDGLSDI